jgi:hypothetical protein
LAIGEFALDLSEWSEDEECGGKEGGERDKEGEGTLVVNPSCGKFNRRITASLDEIVQSFFPEGRGREREGISGVASRGGELTFVPLFGLELTAQEVLNHELASSLQHDVL